jgi:hypothetical protein
LPNDDLPGKKKFEKQININPHMNPNDSIEKLFGKLEGSFDVASPPQGHRERFRERLEASAGTSSGGKKGTWWRNLSIAASIALLLSASVFLFQKEPSMEARVAEISPEVSETSQYFAGLVTRQIQELQKMGSPETEPMIADAIKQLEALEKDYQKLEEDLVAGGNSKFILSAMIQNFQTRIDLLQEVMTRVEEIKQFKNQTHESNTI